MHIGIDASNLRSGGAIVHVVGTLNALYKKQSASNDIPITTIWGARDLLAKLPDHDLLIKKTPFWVRLPFGLRFVWQICFSSCYIKKYGCNILFSPGGVLPLFPGIPCVTMSQNMLLFEPNEALLFGRFSLMRLKFFVLRLIQTFSFINGQGLIFLTQYARQEIKPRLGNSVAPSRIIPHGIDTRFFAPVRAGRGGGFSASAPLRLLYVSPVLPYKHQIEVLHAVAGLRNQGRHISITFAGGLHGHYGKQFMKVLNEQNDSALQFVGNVPQESIHALYHCHDAFVFASSCENLPNIVLEAMAAGLPIISSCKGPMPEVISDGGIYFDPYSLKSIANSIDRVYLDYEFSLKLAARAQENARRFSWHDTAKETYGFLTLIFRQYQAGLWAQHV